MSPTMPKSESPILSVPPASPKDDQAKTHVTLVATESAGAKAGSELDRDVENDSSVWRRRLIVGASLLGPLLALHFFGLPWPLNFWLQAALGAAMQCYVGWPFYASALKRLLHLSVNFDTIVVLSTTALCALGFAEIFWHVGQPDRGLAFVASGLILQVATLRRFLAFRATRRP